MLTTEQLYGVPILLAVGLAVWALWRDARTTEGQPQRKHKWIMMWTAVALEVALGWYWVGLFWAKM